jgi:hypothetical protein
MHSPDASPSVYHRRMELDHLIFGAPDLVTGTQVIEELLGARPTVGAKHVGIGTHNALLSLGFGAYLEVTAPDPDQQVRLPTLPYELDTLAQPGLLTWAIKAPDIEAQAERARARGVDLGPVVPMARERPDGTRLEWRLTRFGQLIGDGLVPFSQCCGHPLRDRCEHEHLDTRMRAS